MVLSECSSSHRVGVWMWEEGQEEHQLPLSCRVFLLFISHYGKITLVIKNCLQKVFPPANEDTIKCLLDGQRCSWWRYSWLSPQKHGHGCVVLLSGPTVSSSQQDYPAKVPRYIHSCILSGADLAWSAHSCCGLSASIQPSLLSRYSHLQTNPTHGIFLPHGWVGLSLLPAWFPLVTAGWGLHPVTDMEMCWKQLHTWPSWPLLR